MDVNRYRCYCGFSSRRFSKYSGSTSNFPAAQALFSINNLSYEYILYNLIEILNSYRCYSVDKKAGWC